MSTPLLNPNQQRRLGTHLRLLVSDLEALAELPELARDGTAFARIQGLLAQTRAAVDALREALSLPPDRTPSLKRRVAAVADVWAARLDDLRAARLKAYGALHPDLARRLDPQLEELRRLLVALADAAGALPEEEGPA